ncbi:MAG: pirin-like C-terminal cupin domain-containing protein [Alphaproteobacteria bacterium]
MAPKARLASPRAGGGRPPDEPVVRFGPLVVSTSDKLIAAVDDYRSGRIGVIERA